MVMKNYANTNFEIKLHDQNRSVKKNIIIFWMIIGLMKMLCDFIMLSVRRMTCVVAAIGFNSNYSMLLGF